MRGPISHQGDGQQPDMGGYQWVIRGQEDESWRWWGHRGGGVLGLTGMAHKGFAVVGEVQAALFLPEGRNPAGGTLVKRRRHCPLGAPGMRSKLWCEESLARAALEAKEEGKVKPQAPVLTLL